ncbi:carboxylesterase family protein [Halopseudomonas pachastrellae]|nr:carboxylesterase family protein [Halopseudomonas pachastrellae]
MDESVANDSMALWAQFAKTGSPATMDIAWPAYTNEREEFLLMDYDMNWRQGLLNYLP